MYFCKGIFPWNSKKQQNIQKNSSELYFNNHPDNTIQLFKKNV